MKPSRMYSFGIFLVMVLLTAILIAGCTQPQTLPVTPSPATTTVAATPTPVVHSPKSVLIATTTSLYDTGLWNAIETYYENKTGIDLKITSQGTGIAIQVATRGDADLLAVHSPSQEKAFIDKGLGMNQRCFAYNYFQIVGPINDPAAIKGLSPEAAFTRIRLLGMNNTPGIFFASRGDSSGTHSAEQNIWKAAGYNYTRDIVNSGPWYLSVGKGMGETLTLASQKGAYTLTDEGTFLAFKTNLALTPLVTQGNTLLNRYSVIAVNPANTSSSVNLLESDRFINWLISDEGKQFVGTYGVDKYGKSLFTPLTGDVCVGAPFNCICTGAVAPA
jgi:tungstate transport system substrate-binding protein